MDPALRILIIDDDAGLRERIAALLADHLPGALFGEAGTVSDGLALANQGNWHVVVLDIRLPDGNGLAALPEVRVRAPEAVIVVMTGLIGLPYASVVEGMGGAAFLPKPDLPDRLVPIIREKLHANRAT